MDYQDELIGLEREWADLRISGEEYANALRYDSDELGRRRDGINAYRRKLMDSALVSEEKEARLRQVSENLRYLDEGSGKAAKQDGDRMLEGVLIGGLLAFMGMYLMDRMGEYLKEQMSEGVMEGLHSGFEGKRFKPDLSK